MSGGRGATKAIVLDVKLLPQFLKFASNLITALLGRAPCFLGGPLDFLSVLVRTGN